MVVEKSGLRVGVVAASLTLALCVGGAQAALVSVSGPLSNARVAAEILDPAPTMATDTEAYNLAQQGFNENQNVLLTEPLRVDGGSIPAGIQVNSHMIFLNLQNGGDPSPLTHNGVQWTFDGRILGVMSDRGGELEAASTPLLGLSTTRYEAPFGARGMEGDSYSIAGNVLTVNMSVSQPGDWIRVVTAVPVPAAAWMGMSLLGGLGAVRRWRRA